MSTISIESDFVCFDKLRLTHPELAEGYPALAEGYPALAEGYPALAEEYPELAEGYPELAEGYSVWTTLTSTRSANVFDFDTLSQHFQTSLRNAQVDHK